MATNDPDHHDVFPGGKAGVEVKPAAYDYRAQRMGRCKPCKRAFLWHKSQASNASKMPCPGCKKPLSATTHLTKVPFEVIS